MNLNNERVIEPSIAFLEKNKSQEISQRILNFVKLIDSHFEKKWQIYIKPHFNGLSPELILLHPSYGIFMIWILEEYDNSSILQKAHILREAKFEICDIYCPRLDGNNKFKGIKSFLILANENNSKKIVQLEKLIEEKGKSYLKTGKKYFYDKIFGNNIFKNPKLILENTIQYPISHEKLKDLQSWLIYPDYNINLGTPPKLDQKQKEIVLSPLDNKRRRRIRGPAGSGKSLVLASRAAFLASQGYKILILTFNHTMINALRNIVLSCNYPKKINILNNITFLNYHGWCKRALSYSQFWESYKLIWKDFKNGKQISAVDKKNLESKFDDTLESILEYEIPELLVQAIKEDDRLKKSRIPRYDAILVDEGQDFLPEWWISCCGVLKNNGEGLFCADPTQNIYNRDLKFANSDNLKMGAGSFKGMGAGFSGRWIELSSSYRLPSNLSKILIDYVENFMPQEDVILPKINTKVENDLFPDADLKFFWHTVSTEENDEKKANICFKSVLNQSGYSEDGVLAIPDTVFLTDSKNIGKQFVKKMEDEKIEIVHTFDDDDVYSKKVFNFYKQQIKATTIHSFKGWESKSIVVYIGNNFSKKSIKELYVALSRVKKDENGINSFLTVINATQNQKLDDFGKKWAQKMPLKILPNRGQKWTESDINLIQVLYKKNKPIEEIAKELGRTTGAIESKLSSLGYVNSKAFSIDELKVFTNLVKMNSSIDFLLKVFEGKTERQIIRQIIMIGYEQEYKESVSKLENPSFT